MKWGLSTWDWARLDAARAYWIGFTRQWWGNLSLLRRGSDVRVSGTFAYTFLNVFGANVACNFKMNIRF